MLCGTGWFLRDSITAKHFGLWLLKTKENCSLNLGIKHSPRSQQPQNTLLAAKRQLTGLNSGPHRSRKTSIELQSSAFHVVGRGLFAQNCGRSGPPFRWDEERRFLLRCELDAALLYLYLGPEIEAILPDGSVALGWRQQPAALTQAFPTPRTAAGYIMDTFPIVKRKDEAKFNGDHRTKRVILEIYDALAASMSTGKAYQTRLDPPPADSRCCHPAKEQAR